MSGSSRTSRFGTGDDHPVCRLFGRNAQYLREIRNLGNLPVTLSRRRTDPRLVSHVEDVFSGGVHPVRIADNDIVQPSR